MLSASISHGGIGTDFDDFFVDGKRLGLNCGTAEAVTAAAAACKPSPQGEEQQQQLHAQFNNHPEIEQCSDMIPFSSLQTYI